VFQIRDCWWATCDDGQRLGRFLRLGSLLAECGQLLFANQCNHPDNCEADDRFGLFMRTPDLKAGYLVGLTFDSRLTMTKWDVANITILVDFVTSEDINLAQALPIDLA
jgi:hypothetical protein